MQLKLLETNEITRRGVKYNAYMLTHNDDLRLVSELMNVRDRSEALAIVRKAYPAAKIALNYFVEGRRVIELM